MTECNRCNSLFWRSSLPVWTHIYSLVTITDSTVSSAVWSASPRGTTLWRRSMDSDCVVVLNLRIAASFELFGSDCKNLFKSAGISQFWTDLTVSGYPVPRRDRYHPREPIQLVDLSARRAVSVYSTPLTTFHALHETWTRRPSDGSGFGDLHKSLPPKPCDGQQRGQQVVDQTLVHRCVVYETL